MIVDQHLLIRYFLGQASEEEKEAIHQWIESDETNRNHFIRERIRFDASILVDEHLIAPPKKRFYIPTWLSWSSKIAASILLVLGSFYVYDNYRMNQFAQTYQSVYVPSGSRTNIVLPDGTSVWLNANSSLQYPIAFTEKTREIILDGEAYLEVMKNKKPFIVKTDKYDIEVLGTTFNVEAYSDKSTFATTLYEGKVKLYNTESANAIYLAPGQTAFLDGDKLNISSTSGVNGYRWKDGLLYIEDKSFSAIMEVFDKMYDVQIIINNKSVNELGYNGKFRISDGIEHALRVLQNDFPFKYVRDKDSNIIYIN